MKKRIQAGYGVYEKEAPKMSPGRLSNLILRATEECHRRGLLETYAHLVKAQQTLQVQNEVRFVRQPNTNRGNE